MSVDDDCELQDLVKQTLEKSGSMSKLRAEMRASVFLAFEENGCFQNLKPQNKDLQNLAQNADGILVICLIREFLDYFGLSFTASVFDPELASYGIHCNCNDRVQLTDQLNVSSDSTNGRKGPLLCQMLQIIRNFQSSTNTQNARHSQKLEKNLFLQSNKSSDISTEYSLVQTPTPQNIETSVVSGQETDNIRNSLSRVPPETFNIDLKPNVTSSPTASKNSDFSKHSLSSLGDLPPLTSQVSSTKNSPSPLNKSSKELSKLKAILKDSSSHHNDVSDSPVISEDEQINSVKDGISELEESEDKDLFQRLLQD